MEPAWFQYSVLQMNLCCFFFFKRRRNSEYAFCISTELDAALFAVMEMAPSCVAQGQNLFAILLHSSGTRGDIHGLGYLYVAEPLSSFRSDAFLRSSVLDSSLLGPALLQDQNI